MANVTQELNNIMNARYGKDVRKSIHDSIEAINSEIVSNNTLVGTFDDRLTENNDLANKIRKSSLQKITCADKQIIVDPSDTSYIAWNCPLDIRVNRDEIVDITIELSGNPAPVVWTVNFRDGSTALQQIGSVAPGETSVTFTGVKFTGGDSSDNIRVDRIYHGESIRVLVQKYTNLDYVTVGPETRLASLLSRRHYIASTGNLGTSAYWDVYQLDISGDAVETEYQIQTAHVTYSAAIVMWAIYDASGSMIAGSGGYKKFDSDRHTYYAHKPDGGVNLRICYPILTDGSAPSIVTYAPINGIAMTKQNKLVPGNNIDIDEFTNTISFVEKPWVLKGTMTTSREVEVDLTGCTELCILGDAEVTGETNLFGTGKRLVSNAFTPTYRFLYARFADSAFGYDCTVIKKYTTPRMLYAYDECDGHGYCWFDGTKISDIRAIYFNVPANVTSCDIKIYAR